jgi:gag-polypeptide of LTR copia-type
LKNKLKHKYQEDSTANVMRLLTDYHSFKMRRGMYIEGYIKDMDAMVDKLRGVGEVVDPRGTSKLPT